MFTSVSLKTYPHQLIPDTAIHGHHAVPHNTLSVISDGETKNEMEIAATHARSIT